MTAADLSLALALCASLFYGVALVATASLRSIREHTRAILETILLSCGSVFAIAAVVIRMTWKL